MIFGCRNGTTFTKTFFAWLPTRLRDGRTAWFETVTRTYYVSQVLGRVSVIEDEVVTEKPSYTLLGGIGVCGKCAKEPTIRW